MSADVNTAIGKELLKQAHETAASGFEVFAFVSGVGRLWVRSVEFMDGIPLIAKVLCWPGDDGKSVSWLVPFAAVRGVKNEEG